MALELELIKLLIAKIAYGLIVILTQIPVRAVVILGLVQNVAEMTAANL